MGHGGRGFPVRGGGSAAQRPGEAGRWGYEELNRFLANPQAEVRGTRMAFAGIRRAEDRANLIAYLEQHGG